jgi:hypothetical protein
MADKKEGEVNANDPDCPKGPCIFTNLAQSLSKPQEVVNRIQANAAQFIGVKVKSVKDTVVDTVTNPLKCAANVVNVVPTMIENVGNAIAGSIDKIGNSLGNATDKAANMVFANPLAPFEIAYYSSLKKLQDIFAGIVLGVDAPTILADPNMNADKLLADMLRNSAAFKKIVDTPDFKEIFDKWLQNYAAFLDKTIELGRPTINKVNDKLTGIVTDTSNKVGEALTKTLTNIITSALRSIPFLGAAVNIVALASKIAERIMSICEPILSKGGFAAATMINTADKQLNKAKCEGKKLMTQIAPLLKQAGGGGGANNKRKKIDRATKRLKWMLNRFTRRKIR